MESSPIGRRKAESTRVSHTAYFADGAKIKQLCGTPSAWTMFFFLGAQSFQLGMAGFEVRGRARVQQLNSGPNPGASCFDNALETQPGSAQSDPLVRSRSALSFHTSICTILPLRTRNRSINRLPSKGVPSGQAPYRVPRL